MSEDRYPYETAVRVQITAWAEWRDFAGSAGGATSRVIDERIAKRRESGRDRFRPTVIGTDAELTARTLIVMPADQSKALQTYHLVSSSTREIARLMGCHRDTVERLLLLGHNEFMRVRGLFVSELLNKQAVSRRLSSVEPHG